MQRRRTRPLDDDEAEEPVINLTPLIDVVFVVLISFMILAPILDIESVNLAPSGPLSQKESPSNSSLSISIQKDGSIWLKGMKLELKELENILAAEKKVKFPPIPQVVPDKSAPFGAYQEVKNLLEILGFEQMEILLKP